MFFHIKEVIMDLNLCSFTLFSGSFTDSHATCPHFFLSFSLFSLLMMV